MVMTTNATVRRRIASFRGERTSKCILPTRPTCRHLHRVNRRAGLAAPRSSALKQLLLVLVFPLSVAATKSSRPEPRAAARASLAEIDRQLNHPGEATAH